jgi:putative endopeptidase
MDAQCIPQNNMDCYNKMWKQTYQSLFNEYPINNFTNVQKKINKEMYTFVDELEPINHTTNNMCKLRDSYANRKNYETVFIKLINQIYNINSTDDLIDMIVMLEKANIPTIWETSVISNRQSPDIYLYAIGTFFLTLIHKDLYEEPLFETKINELYEKIKVQFKHMYDKWEFNRNDFIENVIVFEIAMAKNCHSKIDSKDPKKITNIMNYDEFIKKYDTHNFWKKMSNNNGGHKLIYYENHKCLTFFKNLFDNINDKQMACIKDFIVYKLFDNFKDFILPNINVDNETIITELFYGTFGDFLQDYFDKTYFNKEKANVVSTMFKNMKEYCIDYFEHRSPFEKSTNDNAVKKLKHMNIIIGSQEFKFDFNKMPELSDNFYKNIIAIGKFYYEQIFNMIGNQVNKKILSIDNGIHSFIVNAYYDGQCNAIYIPTATLDNTFINLYHNMIYNYGRIGTIIGHEISHAFDNYGSQYDYLGHLKNWWTTSDNIKFNNEVKKIIKHYNMITIQNENVDANNSVAENMADILGLKISLRTYIKNHMKITNGMTQPQKNELKKFFINWTRTLRSIDFDENLKEQIENDVHAPNVARMNAPFSHIKEYYEIFDVTKDYQTYIHPNLMSTLMD